MRSSLFISLRWFVGVSLVVTLIYMLAVGQGVLQTKKVWARKVGMAARAAAETYAGVTISKFYIATEQLSHEPKIKSLIAQGQEMVSRFGPDSTQTEAARQELHSKVIVPWLSTSGFSDPELVRFYLGPELRKFLTVIHGDPISQKNIKPNTVVTAASRSSRTIVGFAHDDNSIGLRAAAPIWVQGPVDGEKHVVGFVELGCSLSSFIKEILRIGDGNGEASFALLKPLQAIKESAESQAWFSMAGVKICQDGYALIQATSPLIQRICIQEDLKKFLDKQDLFYTNYIDFNGKSYILSVTKLGYWGNNKNLLHSLSEMGIPLLEENKPRGSEPSMLMLMPVEPWTQSMWQFIKTYPIRIGGGMAATLIVIFLAWSLTNAQLSKLVKRRTTELAQTNLELFQTNRELARARNDAEQANQAKSSFLASMSHEIRTPLNVVVGLADLTMGEDLDSSRQENLRAIKDSSRHLLSIINDILDFSKIEAGKVELESLNFNLHELMRTTVQAFRNSAEEKGLLLKLRVDPSTPVYVKGDPMRLRQVINNLLSNALKFTSQGGVSLSVRHESWGEGSSRDGTIRLLFGVKDTGEGVPPEMRGKIFDSFRQADGSTSRRFGGTGLGLAICRQLVEMMGGSICVQSKQGQGSEFIFTAVFRGATPDGVEDAQDQSAEKPAAVTKGVILLVEDNVMNQKVGMAMLKKHGLEVVAAQNGKDAIEKMRNGQFDLVLMDVEMPVMDGIEAARRIRAGEAGKEHMHVPILALTAHALADIQSKCIQAGMNDFLSKPLDYMRLIGIIQDVLAKRSADSIKSSLSELDKKRAVERLGGSKELYKSACALFVGDIPQRIALMRQALEDDDLDALRSHAHYIKGAASTLGATLASSLAESLESAAMAGHSQEAQTIFRNLKPVLMALAQELSAPENG